MKRFENKTILITGASSGIGLAGAKRLVEEGAKVIITGRTESHLEKAVSELGENVIPVLDNLLDGKTLERLLPIVEKTGKLDGLWLNASYGDITPLGVFDKKQLEEIFQVNVFAPMLQMSSLSSHLKDGSSVVVTSSSSVYEGQAQLSAYAATKAAIMSAARAWAAELAPRNIRVNSLVPGPIKSNIRSVLPPELREPIEEGLAQSTLLKRVGEAHEAANVTLFLLSDDSSYVTGTAYQVHGGLIMRPML